MAYVPSPAIKQARSGIARSNTTRSNFVAANITVMLQHFTGGGASVISNLMAYIRAGSLRVMQAINDESDTCSFTLIPDAPALAVGDLVTISWSSVSSGGAITNAPGTIDFIGTVLVVQHERRPENKSPWLFVQCQDFQWQFDARIVSYAWPAQSVTTTIQQLVDWFVNYQLHYTAPGAQTFKTAAYVQPNMPSVPGFEVVNQRPSTVMRSILGQVQGGFYVAGYDVHAWAGGAEPGQPNPTTLTNGLASLKAFRHTIDATQIRQRVIVEGKRTTLMRDFPATAATYNATGLPIEDASIIPRRNAGDNNPPPQVRIGPQWLQVNARNDVLQQGQNPIVTNTVAPYAVGDPYLYIDYPPAAFVVDNPGWLKVGEQFAAFLSTLNTTLPGSTPAYPCLRMTMDLSGVIGKIVNPVPKGETVALQDCITGINLGIWPHSEAANNQYAAPAANTFLPQIVSAPVVILAVAQEIPGSNTTWRGMEAFVQDGRYSMDGAASRAAADLAFFKNPLLTAAWETDDRNARAGRQQVIALTGANPVSATLTISRTDISYPLRTLAPRRTCEAGVLKVSTLLDVILANQA